MKSPDEKLESRFEIAIRIGNIQLIIVRLCKLRIACSDSRIASHQALQDVS